MTDWQTSRHTKGTRWCRRCQTGSTLDQCWVCGDDTRPLPWNEGVMVGTPYKHDPTADDPLDRIVADVEAARKANA